MQLSMQEHASVGNSSVRDFEAYHFGAANRLSQAYHGLSSLTNIYTSACLPLHAPLFTVSLWRWNRIHSLVFSAGLPLSFIAFFLIFVVGCQSW